MRIFEKIKFPISGILITFVLVGCLLTPQTITYILNLSDTLYKNENYTEGSTGNLYKKHVELAEGLLEAMKAELQKWGKKVQLYRR